MATIQSVQPEVLIRACKPGDGETLRRFAWRTYDETFRSMNSPENMQAYLETAFAPEKFAAELANPETRFYLLYFGGELAGYLKLNEAGSQTDLNDPDSLEVERIYVAGRFQGRGLGQLLIEKAISLARQAGKRYLWLGVWQKNTPAIGFYRRMGFRAFASHAFMMGDERQTDDLMRLELGNHEPRGRQGRQDLIT